MNTAVMFSHKSDEYTTPQDFYDKLDAEFAFTLDPCATDDNHKCEQWFTKDDDGLRRSWSGESVFVNPPYSQAAAWVEKCYEEARAGAQVVALLPARTDTAWFHTCVLGGEAEIRFVRGRLKFGPGVNNSAPFPSIVVVWRAGLL